MQVYQYMTFSVWKKGETYIMVMDTDKGMMVKKNSCKVTKTLQVLA